MKALLARTGGNGWRFGFNAALCLMLAHARGPAAQIVRSY